MVARLRYWFSEGIRRSMRRQVDRFTHATKDVRAAQQTVLRRLVALNADSDFGRHHNFNAIRTVQDFRHRLPVSDYEYFRPYVDEVKAGRHSALLGPKNRLLMFTLTSATTSEAKYIPVTSRFLADYRRGWKIWTIRAFDAHPTLFMQKVVQLVSDYDQFHTPGGTPCGNISGLVTHMQNPLTKLYFAIPQPIVKVDSAEAKYYAAMRFSIVRDDIGMITTANPSTVLKLAKLVEDNKELLIRDVADGTLSAMYPVSEQVRAKLTRHLRPNRARARELEAIVSRTGHLYPREFWPHLKLLAVWTGGSVSAYLPALGPYFGPVPVRDHGLSASEGRMTIPMEDGTPEGVLDVSSHFFEFIPEAEYENADPTVLQAHELQEGESYFIVLTTSSGLYRYDIHDLVRCTGFYNTTPKLAFLNKGSHISSITGEKISEHQVVVAVNESALQLQLSLGDFTLAPVWGDPPAYRFLIEKIHLPNDEVAARFVQEIDARLQELNDEYREKRKSGRLAPLSCEPLPEGTWRRFCSERQSRFGGSVDQYKHPCLVPHLDFCKELLADFAQKPTGERVA